MRNECPNTLDPSMGGTIDECLRKFYFRYIKGITLFKEPDYFVAGRAWDNALGAWRTSGTPAERYTKAIDALQNTYDTCNCDHFKPVRTLENLVALFTKYIEWEREEPPYKVLGSNLGFQFPYKDFFLGGELDAYLEWPPYGVVVDENKTTTVIPESKGWNSYEDSFSLGKYANQITHYNWAVRQITEDVWGTRVLVSCLDIPKRSSTKRTLFQPIWLRRPEQTILDYLTLCEERMFKIRRAWDSGIWPKEGQQCTGSWGFSACEYAPLCRLPVRLEEIEIPTNLYRIGEPWAPWNGIKSSFDVERKEKENER